MRFKIDENLHAETADLLRRAGHDALTVWDEGLNGRPDPDIAAACLAEDRVLVSEDRIFADIRAYPPRDYPGLLVIRLARQSRPRILAALTRVLPPLDRETLRGRLWIVSEADVRVRGEQP